MPTRTRQEIAKWLKKQEWYEAYCDNMVFQSRSIETIYKYTNGFYDVDTIFGAFTWAFTPEGDEYWRKINKGFIAWYNGND